MHLNKLRCGFERVGRRASCGSKVNMWVYAKWEAASAIFLVEAESQTEEKVKWSRVVSWRIVWRCTIKPEYSTSMYA